MKQLATRFFLARCARNSLAAIDRTRVHTAATVLALGLMLVLLLFAPASAQFTSFSAPLTGATDFATGFTTCTDPSSGLKVGPIGVLFDGLHFFTDDPCNGTTYRFTSAGGDASTPDLSALNLLSQGLTLKNGIYYGADSFGPQPGLYTFDLNTLATSSAPVVTFPTYAPSPPFPSGTRNLVLDVIGDPQTTDLYISTYAGLFRVQNPTSGSPTVTNLGSSITFDGISFSADGSLFYGAVGGSPYVLGFDRGTNLVLNVNTGGYHVDGIAVAPPNTSAGGIDVSNNIFVNTWEGSLLRIDVNNGNAVSVVASGGSRGDFVTVGADQCLYATQSDRVQKLSPCFFQPSISNKCPLTQGFWKNHGKAWPITSLTLGGQTHSESQLIATMQTAAGGDASLILADQLIAAKLNVLHDSNPATIASTIADADSLLAAQSGSLPFNIDPSSSTGQAMVNDATMLNSYNNDNLTPACTP